MFLSFLGWLDLAKYEAYSVAKCPHLLESSYLLWQSVGEEELAVKGTSPSGFLFQYTSIPIP